MKLILRIFGLFIFGISISGCGESTETICVKDVCIEGTWEWVESYGSIAGITINPQTEMMTKSLTIDETSFRQFEDGALVLDVAYEFIESDEFSTFSDDDVVLKLANGMNFVIFREGDDLILGEPCFDCWGHTYRKK